MLLQEYKKNIVKALQKKFNYTNINLVPKIEKICISAGFGIIDSNVADSIMNDIALISGQRPVATRARKSISNFKIRKGMKLGCKVTIRGIRCYHFMQRFFDIALPRSREFRGVEYKDFDGRGNISVGVKESIIFPEVEYSNISQSKGMNISFITTAKTDEEGFALLEMLGMPFVD